MHSDRSNRVALTHRCRAAGAARRRAEPPQPAQGHGHGQRAGGRADLGFWAVSDINAQELQEFGDKLAAEVRGGA
ncbi:MAG TPA: hypothetical protein VIY51_06080 [Xanthobacteraceae bacterium]